jgi:hypothetical protein
MTTSASDLEGEAQAVSALLDAAKRLEKNPSLFSGDPNSVFTYEDPILAVAALWGRSADVFEQHLLSSASAIEGSNLRKRSVWKWIVTGVRAWFSRHDHARLLLAGKTPTKVISTQKTEVHIAILRDAGFKGAAQDAVVRLMKDQHNKTPFDFVIHLGDVYFAAGPQEMLESLLVPLSVFSHSGGGCSHSSVITTFIMVLPAMMPRFPFSISQDATLRLIFQDGRLPASMHP